MKMTRQHFKLIAETIKDFGDATEYKTIAHCLANEFAQKLRATNPQFKREVFLRACGVSS